VRPDRRASPSRQRRLFARFKVALAVIPTHAGIQTVAEGDPWIPGQARNDDAGTSPE
jgi:hypothetical protein